MYLKPSRRKKAKTRTVIIIIAAAAAAGVLILCFALGLFPSFSIAGEVKPLDQYLPDMVFANDDGILYNESDTLHLIDYNGLEQWNLKLEMEGSTTVTSPKLICNYAGKTIQVMTYTKEQMFTTTIDSDILAAAAGQDAAAVLTSAPGETGSMEYFITLFNTKGEQTGHIKMNKRQVIEFGFHGDADKFWVLSLDSDGVVPVSYIGSYKTDGSPTDTIMIDTQIVEQVYVTDNSFFASGTNSVASYTYFGEKQAELQIYGWRPVADSLKTNSIRLAYAPRSIAPDIDAVRLCDTDLTDTHIRLPASVFAVAVTQDRFYAYADEKIYTYLQDGKLEKEIGTDAPIVKVKQLSDTCAILWDQQKSYVMTLA